MNQRDGVFGAVVAVIGDVSGAVSLNSEQKKQVYAHLFAGFKSGQIELATPKNDAELTKYIPGLVNNWLRKDTRLNGGVKYVTKHPGSRAGTGDETMKAMRMLLSVTTDSAARAEIEAAIATRTAELKKPTVTLNVSALPPELRKFAGQ